MAQTSAVSKIISGYRLPTSEYVYTLQKNVSHFVRCNIMTLLCTYTNLRYTVPTYLVVHRHFQLQCARVDTMTFVILHYQYII